MCQELSPARTAQRSVSGEVHDTAVSERLCVELAGSAIGGWALALLTLLGVLGHGVIRVVSHKRNS